ncbi:MAG: PAS domain S-box protein [Elusimicrobiota bacterium]
MNVMPYIHLLSAMAYLCLVVFILVKNIRSPLNKSCAGLLICLAAWSSGMVFINDPDTSMESAILVDRVFSFGWIGFASFFLLFTLIFTGRDRNLRPKYYYPLIFFPPVFFYWTVWTDKLLSGYVRYYYGWTHVYTDSIYTVLFYAYYHIFVLGGIYLLVLHMKRTLDVNRKKQAFIIISTTLITLTAGTLINVVLPELNIMVIPKCADIVSLIWASGVAYAVVKYKFMTISPATAADNIIETMMECLILLDSNGRILTENRATLKTLGYVPDNLKGKKLSSIVAESDLKGLLIDKINNSQTVKNIEVDLITGSGDNIPVIFSASPLKEEDGRTAGIVCIARDITDLKRTEQERNLLIDELRESLENIKKLRGLLPICLRCKKIRNDTGYWDEVETYIKRHSDAVFSHGYCPECSEKEMAKIRYMIEKDKKQD